MENGNYFIVFDNEFFREFNPTLTDEECQRIACKAVEKLQKTVRKEAKKARRKKHAKK